VRAVRPRFVRPAAAAATLQWLIAHREDQALALVAQSLGRVASIVPPGTAASWDPNRAAEPAEAHLRAALGQLQGRLRSGAGGVAAFVAAAEDIVAPIDAFFGEVFINAEDPDLRRDRLGLLASITQLAQQVIDWTELK
jgi:glycyl-tRNA synthetase